MSYTFTFRRNFSWPKAGEWRLTHTIGPRTMSEDEAKLEVCVPPTIATSVICFGRNT